MPSKMNKEEYPHEELWLFSITPGSLPKTESRTLSFDNWVLWSHKELNPCVCATGKPRGFHSTAVMFFEGDTVDPCVWVLFALFSFSTICSWKETNQILSGDVVLGHNMGLISIRWAVVICQGPPTKTLTVWVYQNPTGCLRAKIIKPCYLSRKKIASTGNKMSIKKKRELQSV